MSFIETYRNTLTYALAIAGNERVLAERLGVKVQQVLNWTMGIERVPTDIFLKAVDVVLAATADEIRQSREILSRLKLTADGRTIEALRRGARFDGSTPAAQRDPKSLSAKQDS